MLNKRNLIIIFFGTVLIFLPINNIEATDTKHPFLYFNYAELQKIKEKSKDTSINKFGFSPKESFESIRINGDSLLFDYNYHVAHKCLDGSGGTVDYNYTLSSTTPPYQTCDICCPWTQMTGSIEARLSLFTFLYAVTGNQIYLNKIKEIMFAVSAWNVWADPSYGKISISTSALVRGISFAYDVAYNDLTEQERKTVVDALVEKGLKPLSDFLSSDPINNSQISNIAAFGMGVLAIKNEHSFANQQQVENAIRLVEKYFSNQDRDGGMYEGIFYGDYAIKNLFQFIVPLKRLGVYDFFEDPFMKKVWNYPIYFTSGDKMVSFNDAGDGLSWNNELSYAACVLKNKEAAWYLNKYGYGFNEVLSFIWLDDSVEFKEPENTSMLFRDMGTGVLRYSWDDLYPVMFFKSGPDQQKNVHDIHAQFDQNTFSIMSDRNWVAADAGYDQPETFKHNTILVDGQGQSSQLGGRVTDFYTSKYFDYIKGDASKVYNSISKFDRSVFFVKPDYFITYDEIQSSENHKFSWLIHSDGNGSISNTNENFEIIQPRSNLKGEIISDSILTETVESMDLTSGMVVGDTTYSKYLKLTTGPRKSTTFLSLLYPTSNENKKVLNGDFEEFLDNGNAVSWIAAWNPTMAADSNVKLEGNKSQRMSSTLDYSYIWQEIPVTPGKTFVASVYAKTQNAKNINMRLWWEKDLNNVTSSYVRIDTSNELKGTLDWTKMEITGVVPKDAISVRFVLFTDKDGIAWFDNASYVELDSETKGKAIEFKKINSNAAEILSEEFTDLVSINFNPGSKNISSSKGQFECDGSVCILGLDKNNNLNRLILYNGKILKLDEVSLLSANVNIVASLKREGNDLVGEIQSDGVGNLFVRYSGKISNLFLQQGKNSIKILTSTSILPTCTQNWQCSSWGVCENSQQTRTCTDSNSCGATTNKPTETQSCTSTTTGGDEGETSTTPTTSAQPLTREQIIVKINEIKAQIAVLMIELQKIRGTSTTQSFTTYLYYGIKDNLEVKRLQDFLTSKGYLAQGLSNGDYLLSTAIALFNYQKNKGISPANGFHFGPKSREAVNAELVAK